MLLETDNFQENEKNPLMQFEIQEQENISNLPTMAQDNIISVPQVIIKVIERDGTELGYFPANKNESILDTAEKHDIDIGYSCRSGACFSCACTVKKGFENIDIGKFGYQLVDVDEGDCLTCIAGINDDARDGTDKEIILKKF